MQRLTSEYRASLILAAANADASLVPAETPQLRDSARRERRSDYRDAYRDHYRDLEGFEGDHRDVDYRDLSGTDYDDDQPTYWYWRYDHPDAEI